MSISKKTLILSIALASILSLSTHTTAQTKGKATSPSKTAAQSFSYNYVEGGFADHDIDSGLMFRGSFLLNNNVFLAGSIQMSDLEILKVGAGYRFPHNSKTEFYGKVSYVDISYDTGLPPLFPGIPTDVSDDGLELSGGVRFQLDPKFELGGGVNMFMGDESDTGIFVSGTYKINNQFGASLEINTGDWDTMFISGRYNF